MLRKSLDGPPAVNQTLGKRPLCKKPNLPLINQSWFLEKASLPSGADQCARREMAPHGVRQLKAGSNHHACI